MRFLPENLQIISDNNIQNLRELARIGRGSVHQVAFIPDGKHLAAASSIGIWLYDVEFQNNPILLGKDEYSNKMAFSADGGFLAAPSHSGHIAVWNIATREQVQIIADGKEYAHSLALHPRGVWLASGSYSDGVYLWNTETGLLDRNLPSDEMISSMSFSSDGQYIAIGSMRGTLRLWHLPSNQAIDIPNNFPPHAMVQVAFDSTDTLAYGYDGEVILWDLTTQQERKRLSFPNQSLQALAFSPNGRLLATANWAGAKSGPGHVRLWNLDSGEEQTVGNSGAVSVSFRSDGKVLAYTTGGWNGTVYLWDIEAREKYHLPGHGNVAGGLAFSHDGRSLAYGASRGFIRVMDVPSGREKASLQKPHRDSSSAPNTFAFNPDDSALVFLERRKVFMWHLDSNQIEDLEVPNNFYFDHSTQHISFDPSGRNLLIGSSRPFMIDVGQQLMFHAILHEEGDFTVDATLSPNGDFIAECGYFKSDDPASTIRLWRMPAMTRLKSFQQPFWAMECIVVSPDGRKVAVAGRRDSGNRMTAVGGILDVDSGAEIFSFTGKTYYGSSTNHAIFNPSGDLAVFGTTSGTLSFWSMHSHVSLLTLQAHNSSVWNTAFSPDGRLLVTIGSDSTLRFWGVAT